eukprot:COSAG02_NODE_7943_length_2776_cov_3.405304_3_plen_32_part_01
MATKLIEQDFVYKPIGGPGMQGIVSHCVSVSG